MKQPAQIGQYTDGDLLVKVFAPGPMPKRVKWQKNDTFYGVKLRIFDDSMFAQFTRKKGKA